MVLDLKLLKLYIIKKLLFGLIATVMFGFVGNAQTKLTKEDVRLKLATTMSELVSDATPIYKKGMSYDGFINLLLNGGTTGPTFPIPTQEGQFLLKAVYEYVSIGATTDYILRNDDGKVMAAIAKISGNSKSKYESAVKVFGQKIVDQTQFGQNITSDRAACCKWLGHLFSWIWENHDEILQILCMFINC